MKIYYTVYSIVHAIAYSVLTLFNNNINKRYTTLALHILYINITLLLVTQVQLAKPVFSANILSMKKEIIFRLINDYTCTVYI